MTMIGANTTEVRNLALRMEQAAATLEHGSKQLQAKIGATRWTGDAAQRFMWEWSRLHRPSLAAVARDLRAAARVARHNADQQDAASGGASGSIQRSMRPGMAPGHGRPGPGGAVHGTDPGWIGSVWDWVGKVSKGSEIGIVALAFGSKFIPRLGSLPGRIVDAKDYQALLVRSGSAGAGKVGLLKNLKSPGTWAGAGFSAVVGGFSVFLSQRENGWGHAETVTAGVDGTLSTAFSFVPGGSIVYGVTRTMTDAVYGMLDREHDMSGEVVNDYARRAYGVSNADELTPAQAQALTDRYNGVKGLGNATVDGVRSLGEGAVNKGKALFNGIKRIF